MKKILTTIVLAASITICFAQWQQNPQRGGGPNPYPYPANTRQGGNYNNMSGSLVVSSASSQQFSVSVDNNQYQSNGNNTVNLGQLNPGNHNVVISEWRKNFWGKEVQKVIYNATLNLKQGYETAIFINSNGQVSVSERQVYNNNNNNTQGGYGNNGNGVGHGYGRDKNKHKKNQKNHDNDDCDDDRNYRGNEKDRNNRK